MTSRQQLLEAARAVITTLQRRPELHEAKVIIIGGVALQTHAPNRATQVGFPLASIHHPFCS